MLHDGADCILNTVVCALRDWFTPDQVNPPLGGGTTTVRLFAGDVIPTSLVDMHVNDPACGCTQPFVWVRLLRRYRSREFPQPYVGDDPCGTPVVIAVEVGIARCATLMQNTCTWAALETEAEVSLDDSRRIELALCRAAGQLKQSQCSDAVAIDSVLPHGPDGGVLGWVGTLYVRIDT